MGVSPEQEFMCCFCTQDGMNEYYAEAMASDDYLEIMELYTDRLKGQVAALQAQRKTLHIPLASHDLPGTWRAYRQTRL